ncbi:MAG TPA: DUF4870 domain-containing protein [Microbacteriaceae bacterium]
MSDATPPPGNPYQASNQLNPADEKLWSTLIHVLGIFFSFLPALIGYLVLKDRGPFVRQHSAAALNFQLTMLIAYIVGLILTIVIVGIFIILAVEIVIIIFSILAAIAANKGQNYTYPMSIKFIK